MTLFGVNIVHAPISAHFQKHEHFSYFSKNCSCFSDRLIPYNNPHYYKIVRVFNMVQNTNIIKQKHNNVRVLIHSNSIGIELKLITDFNFTLPEGKKIYEQFSINK